MPKPSTATLPRWATDGGANVVEPSSGKKDDGWTVNEKPPASYFNWLQKMAYTWLAWLDEVIPDGGPIARVSDNVAHCARNLTLRDSGGYTDDFNGVCFGLLSGARRFVAAGVDEIMHSIDGGKHWASGTGVGAAGIFRAVAFNGTVFVAVGGASTTPIIYSSADGVAWTSRTPGGTPGGFLTAITWDSTVGLFVAVGTAGECQTSPDGVTWTKRTMAAADDFAGITSRGGTYWAVGDAGSNVGITQRSTNGTSWTRFTMPAQAGGMTAVTVDDDETILAVGVSAADTAVGFVYASTDDGATWAFQASLGDFVPLGVAWLGGVYVACTDSSTSGTFGDSPAVVTSQPDLTQEWSYAHAASAQEADGAGAGGTMRAITTDGRKFVVVGSGGTLSDSLTV